MQVGLMSVALVACDSGNDPAAGGAGGGDDVAKAVEIAKEIKADASKAEDVLKKHSLSVEQWEDMMFAIAEDPAKSAEFEKGVGG
jgi:hypothetical protein